MRTLARNRDAPWAALITDLPACFAALLDDERAGRWLLAALLAVQRGLDTHVLDVAADGRNRSWCARSARPTTTTASPRPRGRLDRAADAFDPQRDDVKVVVTLDGS